MAIQLYRSIELSKAAVRTLNMARKFDMIVFGATGFTGQYVAEEVARIAEEEKVSWAVAGRNVEKLKKILENVEKATGTE